MSEPEQVESTATVTVTATQEQQQQEYLLQQQQQQQQYAQDQVQVHIQVQPQEFVTHTTNEPVIASTVAIGVASTGLETATVSMNVTTSTDGSIVATTAESVPVTATATVAAEPPPLNLPYTVLHKGILFKQGSRMQSWKKRFHCLRFYEQEQCVVLVYHATEADSFAANKKALGVHDLYHVYSFGEHDVKEHGMVLYTIDEKQKKVNFCVAAETAEEKYHWMEALRRARRMAKNPAPKEFLAFDNLGNQIYDSIFSIIGQNRKLEDVNEEVRGRIDALRKLQTLNNCVWEFENRVTDYTGVSSSYVDKFGDNLGTYYLRPLSVKIAAFCEQEELVKQEFIELCHASYLVFEFDAGVQKYNQLIIRDGALVIQMTPQNYMTNAGQLGDDFTAVLSAHSVKRLPLNVRINAKNSIPTRDTALSKISAATETPFTFDCDLEELYNTPEVPANYKDNMPQFIYGSYLTSLASYIESFCQDAMKKETLLELVSTRKISFEWATLESGYVQTAVRDGILYIQTTPAKFATNVGECGRDLMNSMSSSPSHKLPLAERMSVRDAQANLATYMNNISEAAGRPFTFEADFEALYFTENVAKDYRNTMAQRIVNNYLSNVASRIASLCTSSAEKKEAFANAISASKITFVFGALESGYNETVVEDGALVIRVPPASFCTNVNDCGSKLSSLF